MLKGVINISQSDKKKRLRENKSNIRQIFDEGLNVNQRKTRLQKISNILPFLIRTHFQHESRINTDTKR